MNIMYVIVNMGHGVLCCITPSLYSGHAPTTLGIGDCVLYRGVVSCRPSVCNRDHSRVYRIVAKLTPVVGPSPSSSVLILILGDAGRVVSGSGIVSVVSSGGDASSGGDDMVSAPTGSEVFPVSVSGAGGGEEAVSGGGEVVGGGEEVPSVPLGGEVGGGDVASASGGGDDVPSLGGEDVPSSCGGEDGTSSGGGDAPSASGGGEDPLSRGGEAVPSSRGGDDIPSLGGGDDVSSASGGGEDVPSPAAVAVHVTSGTTTSGGRVVVSGGGISASRGGEGEEAMVTSGIE